MKSFVAFQMPFLKEKNEWLPSLEDFCRYVLWLQVLIAVTASYPAIFWFPSHRALAFLPVHK